MPDHPKRAAHHRESRDAERTRVGARRSSSGGQAQRALPEWGRSGIGTMQGGRTTRSSSSERDAAMVLGDSETLRRKLGSDERRRETSHDSWVTTGGVRRRQRLEEVEALVLRDRHDSLDANRLAGTRRAFAALLTERRRGTPSGVNGSEAASAVCRSLRKHSHSDIEAHEEMVVN